MSFVGISPLRKVVAKGALCESSQQRFAGRNRFAPFAVIRSAERGSHGGAEQTARDAIVERRRRRQARSVSFDDPFDHARPQSRLGAANPAYFRRSVTLSGA